MSNSFYDNMGGDGSNTDPYEGENGATPIITTPFDGQLKQNGAIVSATNRLPVDVTFPTPPSYPTSLTINNANSAPIPIRIVGSDVVLSAPTNSGTPFDGIIKNDTSRPVPVALAEDARVAIAGTVPVSGAISLTGVHANNGALSVALTSVPAHDVRVTNALTVNMANQPTVNINGTVPVSLGTARIRIDDTTPLNVNAQVVLPALQTVRIENPSLAVTLSGTNSVNANVTGSVSVTGLPDVTVRNPFDGTLKHAGAAVSSVNRLPVSVSFPTNQNVTVTGTASVNATIQGTPTVALQSNAVEVTNPLRIDTSATPLRVEVTNPSSGGGSGGTFDGNVKVTSGKIDATIVGTPTVGVSGTVQVAGNVNIPNPIRVDTVTPLRVEVTNPSSGGGTGGSVTVSNLPDTQKVSIANAVTVQGAVGVTGSVEVTALPSVTIANPTTSVSINNLPTTQAVSLADPVTIANPVTSVSINNLPTTQAVSFADPITVANPFNGVLTLGGQAVSTSNRLPVGVSGSVSISGVPSVQVTSLPNVQLAVNGVNVSASNRYPVEVQFPSTQAVSITGTPAVTVSGTVTTTPTRVGPAVAPMNISGTLSATNTAQQIAGANADRRGGWLQNNSTSDLWLNDLGTATIGGSSLKIPAGGYYEFPATGVPTGALSIIGANTGQAWSGRVW